MVCMLKKIPVREVRVGMYLHELSGSSWINHPFWKTKFVLKDQADLERLVNSPVTEVWIDAELGLDVAPPAAPEPVVAVEPAPEPEPPALAPAPPDAAEVADRQTQSTPLEPNTTSKKKKKFYKLEETLFGKFHVFVYDASKT